MKIVISHLNYDTARHHVVAGPIVSEEKHRQTDGKEERQRKVLDYRPHNGTVNSRPLITTTFHYITSVITISSVVIQGDLN